MIDRAKVLKGLECWGGSLPCIGSQCPYHDEYGLPSCRKVVCSEALAMLKDQQNTINCLIIAKEALFQTVEEQKQLVRCKDCVYYIAGGGCGNINGESPARNLIDVRPDWFCADGERRTE